MITTITTEDLDKICGDFVQANIRSPEGKVIRSFAGFFHREEDKYFLDDLPILPENIRRIYPRISRAVLKDVIFPAMSPIIEYTLPRG